MPRCRFLLLPLLLVGCSEEPVTAPDGNATTPEDQALATTLDAEAGAARIPFADADVFFELNTTDDDLGLQVFLDAEGWKKVAVLGTDARPIAEFEAEGNLAQLGITELRIESAEPSPGEVLALFPPGTYRFGGLTVGGDLLVGRATLEHRFASPPTFTPSGGTVVDPNDVVVEWNAPRAELVEVIIESDDLDAVFDVVVPAETGRLSVPPEFLEPGTVYKIELLSISENGNKTIAESTFVTMPNAGS